MTPQQIVNRVQKEADARFGETIERLLFLLERQYKTRNHTFLRIEEYVKKWSLTGLLDNINDYELKKEAAIALEEGAWELIKLQTESIDKNSFLEGYITEYLKEKVLPFEHWCNGI
jgi:hypothetical protein